MVAFVFRFKTQAFADSSQLGSLTELNFPVSDPGNRVKMIKDVISKRFCDAFCVFVVDVLLLSLAEWITQSAQKTL